ncbi:MAG: bifunctional phosphopantothenoylcysteine decarboxylase/phosphopantothenate--cysteine ligase CoaBC [Deltaproteobacteria bacterium]|nr:bifunctional phosphopantothenoylcysteine decarboxylase/phosphopantothenate--cysteine ligase CoaBC [Deltaproteobacteria bacterium]
MESLKGRNILLGVTGGIAAYKAVEILRLLKKAGADVSVVMTAHAREFVAPLTFQTLSGRPVASGLFDLDQENRINHIRLAEEVELALVAPCTANFAAKLRAGLADDLLSTMLLATTAPVCLALAMNDKMLNAAPTRENIRVLQERGVCIIPPEEGFLAEGTHAPGRLADPASIVAQVAGHFRGGASGMGPAAVQKGVLAGRKVLVTAGPTREMIDPVRFISNRSSGRMGYALAGAAAQRGAEVVLVSGPTGLNPPPGVRVLPVVTAGEMLAAVRAESSDTDVFVFAAAVSDFRAAVMKEHKIKRGEQGELSLELLQNADIAAETGRDKRPGQVSVVFAAESRDLLENAARKLAEKNADLVVANDITERDSGFDSDRNRAALLTRGAGEPQRLPLMEKTELAGVIMEKAVELLSK